ncbi:MAG: tRNA (adenosine(37)-N6)-threonylcarbamoyltransferase complex dimerization subunit type 1 TsaB [Bacteroidales bacterium]|nr:tRNA (adenosine(37)-N6)-threonylcarbamoyltransferase complex dimerization subunit type 1 TsaB [Bacteroidales bacterium]
MALILLLETSTSVLSVALSRDGQCIASKVCTEPRMQASLTAPYVKDLLDGEGIGIKDCDAVCVSMGPGSFTGLRVGVSTAKGLAFGAGIPLLATGTLDILVRDAVDSGTDTQFIVPMIDARRMEVYSAVFSPDGRQLTETAPTIVDALSFAPYLEKGKVLFTGDGAMKCREVLQHPNAVFEERFPLARAMAPLAEEAYKEKRFQDLAYFEPFYLKDFVATVSRKKLF